MGHGSCRCYSIRTERTVHNYRSPWRLDSGCSIVLTNLRSSIFKKYKNNIKIKKNLICYVYETLLGRTIAGHILSLLD
jgi:hypothetical protein